MNFSRKQRSLDVGARVLKESLTPDGRDWIIAALDPFHDFQRQLAGYPDLDSCHTTVACYQSEIDISKPAGVIGNWDAHVFSLPMARNMAMYQVKSTSGDIAYKWDAADPEPTLRQMSALNVWAADSGQPLFGTATANYNPTNLEVTAMDTSSFAGIGVSRVIAWGYEIVNTTADLTKQGALTAYRMPQMLTDDEALFMHRGSAGIIGQCALTRIRAPPATPAQAMLLGGTRQWAAADGAYVVVPQSGIANPLAPSANRGPMISVTCPMATGEYAFAWDDVVTTAGNAAPLLTGMFSNPQRYLPYNTTGVFLTGLSNTTTFRVKLKMYVEKAPSFAESETSVLASPSASYDAYVLELYSKCISQLPVAVPVSMNGFGDWFRNVLGVIADVATPIGAAIGGPPGAAIGSLVGNLAGGIRKEMSSQGLKTETKSAVMQMNNERNSKTVVQTKRNPDRVRKPFTKGELKKGVENLRIRMKRN